MFKYHIQTVQVGAGGSSTISFSNIPQIYDDLVLVTSLRDNVGSGGWENAFIYPNNSSANMASRFMYGWGSNNTGSGVNNPAVIYHQTARGNNTANTFSNSSVTISNYSKSTFKSISAETSVERNDVAGINAFTSALWSDSSAINNLTIAAASGVFVQHSSASLYGIKRGSDGKTEVASGGTITISGGYTIHTFNTSGTFVANRNLAADVLVIAGGGGGGNNQGGGGGAGGYIAQSLTLASTSYLVTVGAGGTGMSVADGSSGSNGSNSVLASLTAIGGGRGGSGGINNAQTGGSGGGGGAQEVAGTGAAGTSAQGFAGANGSGTFANAGGGGGAGEAGNTDGVRAGGDGLASSITGTSVIRAGGGSGGGSNGTSVAGGDGGGGTGTGGNSTGGAGTANTGSGGGGGGSTPGVGNAAGGAGGSGVVIIRYLTPA